MTTLTSLPLRPSLESLRKQAKKFARDVAAGNVDAIARARSQLPNSELPLSQRDAQLVLAREYGFAGWQQLKEEVLKRIGNGLEWALVQAKHTIHNNDVERLQQLLTEYPALLSWRDEFGGALLNAATNSFGDCGNDYREKMFTRPACAEVLIDAGAAIDASMWQHVIGSRAKGMLQLLWHKGVLPRTLVIFAALDDLDAVRACCEESHDLGAMNEAFLCACRFNHKAMASFLLDHCIVLDIDLGKRIDSGLGRLAFVEYLIEHAQEFGSPWQTPVSPWRAFVMIALLRAIHENDLSKFILCLQSESWLLGDSCVDLQVQLIEQATLNDRGPFIMQLLHLDPAMLRLSSCPQSQAIKFALEYGKAHLVPLLTRLWSLPDDLPHAAAMGDFARVKRWLSDLNYHHSASNSRKRVHQHSDDTQRMLDVALAWACMNKQLEIAALLLEHGANIDNNWSTHEPASILHELVFHNNYEAMQFLIDRGIDMTILDHRWNATAEGWARHAAKNEAMAEFLAVAEQQRRIGSLPK